MGKNLSIYSLLLLTFTIVSVSSCINNNVDAKNNKSSMPDEFSEIKKNKHDFIKPVEVQIDENINTALAAKGKITFDKLCTACHHKDQKFIGPKMRGITEKRQAYWIMNMIINPEDWVKIDPEAIKLLKEYNYAPMINQGLNFDESREVYEYLRTLK